MWKTNKPSRKPEYAYHVDMPKEKFVAWKQKQLLSLELIKIKSIWSITKILMLKA